MHSSVNLYCRSLAELLRTAPEAGVLHYGGGRHTEVLAGVPLCVCARLCFHGVLLFVFSCQSPTRVQVTG